MPCVTHPGSLYGVVTEGRAGPRFGWCGRVHFSGKFFSNNLSQLEGCDSHVSPQTQNVLLSNLRHSRTQLRQRDRGIPGPGSL